MRLAAAAPQAYTGKFTRGKAILPSLVLTNIIAGVCLLLWGVTLLRLGVTRGFGAGLRRFLAACTATRAGAFIAGVVITAFLQSSMATTLIVSGFVTQGMVTPAAALAVVLGADVGTALVARLLSLDLAFVMPLAMMAGYILFSIEKTGVIKNIGRIFVGLALMLMALQWIRETAQPLKDSEILPMILAPLEKDPVFAVILVALLTWAAHSSLAIILLLMSFASAHIIPVPLALYMVLGANLGGTIAPLVATLRDMPSAQRIPVGNTVMRFAGVVAVAPFVPFVPEWLTQIGSEGAITIIHFHIAFNVALALFFLPLTGILSAVLDRLMPLKTQDMDLGKARYLQDKDLDTPSVALAGAARETLRLSELLQQMLNETITVLQTNDEKLLEKVREDDNTMDRLYAQIKQYMARLTQEFMDKSEAQRYVQILMFSTNLEHAGDIIDKNLMALGLKKIRNQFSFSPAGMAEIQALHNRVMESLQLAQSVFVSGDVAMARRLVATLDDVRKAELEGFATHIDRLRGNVPETVATSALHLDIMRDYRRIHSYICAVAYPLLEDGTQAGWSLSYQGRAPGA